jgi:hypothetical protein
MHSGAGSSDRQGWQGQITKVIDKSISNDQMR